MKLRMWVQFVVMGASACVLAACSTAGHQSGKAGAYGGMSVGKSSAQTYALKGSSNYRTNAQGFVVNSNRVPSNQTYYFAFNKSMMRSQDVQSAKMQANFLATHPKATIRLEGNTDNRGSREYNIGLGWRRDQSVARLLEQLGVNPSQIQMVSYGKERPAVLGNNPHAWTLNRRVNFIYKTY